MRGLSRWSVLSATVARALAAVGARRQDCARSIFDISTQKTYLCAVRCGGMDTRVGRSSDAPTSLSAERVRLRDFFTKLIGCKKNEILVSSTGVIGETFDPNLIINKICKINQKNTGSLIDAAKAIMTTDTYPKTSVKTVKYNNKYFKIYGFAKGSGMIQPNMGTMLVYIFIEANVPKKILKKLLIKNVENTFNAISTDGDTSTSDTLAIFSLNKFQINLKNKKNLTFLEKHLSDLMRDLSLKVVKDGEGLSKLIKLNILNCKSKLQAKKIAFSIVNSPLVKTAISGEDANWGRVIAAIGKSQVKLNQNKVKIFFGKNKVCQNGSVYKRINLSKLNKYMKNKIIEISVYLYNGNINHTVYGNDLTHEYIRINGEYRS